MTETEKDECVKCGAAAPPVYEKEDRSGWYWECPNCGLWGGYFSTQEETLEDRRIKSENAPPNLRDKEKFMEDYRKENRRALMAAIRLLERQDELVLSLPVCVKKEMLAMRDTDINRLFRCLAAVDAVYDENGDMLSE